MSNKYPVEPWNADKVLRKLILSEPTPEAGNVRAITFTLYGADGKPVEEQTGFKVNSFNAGATFTLKAGSEGLVIGGAGTQEIQVVTGQKGSITLDLAFAAAATIRVVPSPGYASGWLNCEAYKDVVFV